MLGRRLMKLGELAMRGADAPAIPVGTRLVMGDVLAHPGSSIKQITDRTGLQQSHVSVVVAAMRERGVVETTTDPDDRRRTLVSVSDGHTRRVAAAGAAPVDEVLAVALGDPDPQAVAEVVRQLDELAGQLRPEEEGVIARELSAARAALRGVSR